MDFLTNLINNPNILKFTALGDLVVSIATFLISLLTLIVGYRAYRKFIFQQATSKQLDLVIELINTINLSEINIVINYNHDDGVRGSDGSLFDRNLFDVATWGAVGDEVNYKIFIPLNNNLELIPAHITNNPILPKGIADSLYKFYSHFKFSFVENRKEPFSSQRISSFNTRSWN